MSDISIELADATTPAARLAELAQQHPEWGAAIAAHPNTYPALREWIAQYATPAAAPAPVVEPPVTPAAFPTAPQAFPSPASPAAPAAFGAPPSANPPQFGVGQASLTPPQYGAPPQAATPPQYGAAPHSAAPPQFAAPQQYGTPQQYPSPQPYGEAPQYAGYPGYPTPGAPQAGPAKKKNKALGWIIGGSAAALALIIGGVVVWATVGSKLGGAPTPVAAVEKFLNAGTSLDPIAVYGSLAPSEISPLQNSLQQLTQIADDDADVPTFDQYLADIRSVVSIEVTTPLEMESDEIVADEVERVTVTEGAITIDGDPEEVADVVMEYVAPYMTMTMAQSDYYTEDEIEEMVEESRDDLVEQLSGDEGLPYTFDVAEDTSGDGIVFITVREGGSWYLSPMMSVADAAFGSGSLGSFGELGDEILPAATEGNASAEEAMESFVTAIADGDYEEMVSYLPLAERRLVSIYGPALAGSGDIADSFEESMDYMQLSIDEASFSSEATGNVARVTIEELVLSWGDSYGGQLRITTENSGMCWESEYENLCPGDEDVAASFGYDEWRPVAIKESGGWFFSPITTIGDIAGIVSVHMKELADEGKLDEVTSDLWGTYYGGYLF